MPAVQTDYQERIGEYYEGMVINPHTCDVSSYIAGGTIGFGSPVIRGAADDKVVEGIKPTSGGSNPFHATAFYGVTIKDPTRDPEDNDNYSAGAHVNVLWRGDIVVAVKAAVTAGSLVKVDASDNAFTGAAASATIPVINGARFLKDAAAGGLTILRLYGNEQILETG